jgi:hypothetical protein
MDVGVVDDVARMLAHKCRAAANDPFEASVSREEKKSKGGGDDDDLREHPLLREVAATQAEASVEAHVEASATWHMAREYEQEGAEQQARLVSRKTENSDQSDADAPSNARSLSLSLSQSHKRKHSLSLFDSSQSPSPNKTTTTKIQPPASPRCSSARACPPPS